MKTYEEAVSIVAEVRLSRRVSDVQRGFNHAGALLLAKIYKRGENEVANDCYELYITRREAMDKAIKEARKVAARAENEERRQVNLTRS